MNLLLDTHTVLWALAGGRPLTEEAREAIRDPENAVYVSAVSAWEIAIKRALGKLEAPRDFANALAATGFTPLLISIEHGLAAGNLPRHHDDPFDRMLIAQAQAASLVLVTRDRHFAAYDVRLMAA